MTQRRSLPMRPTLLRPTLPRPTLRRPALLLGVLMLPVILAGCVVEQAPPPVAFTPLQYGYLTPLRLSVASLDVVDHSTHLQSNDVSNLSPEPPAVALAQMARDRLIPSGSAGRAVFVIDQSSILQDGPTLTGTLAVHLDIYSGSGGARSGYAEARVSRIRSVTGGSEDLRSALYLLTRQMMDDMNVEFEYQVRHSLRDWLQTTARGAVLAPVQQAPLAAPPGTAPSPDMMAPGSMPPGSMPPGSMPGMAPPDTMTPGPTPSGVVPLGTAPPMTLGPSTSLAPPAPVAPPAATPAAPVATAPSQTLAPYRPLTLPRGMTAPASAPPRTQPAPSTGLITPPS